jgi:hypothetical protein
MRQPHNKPLQTDERRVSVPASCTVTLAPLAAERQRRYADSPKISRSVKSANGARIRMGSARKAELNRKEHGASFDEATTVFRDTLSITIADPDHSDSEDRFVDIGMSHRGQLLVVSYTERKHQIRIISARPPTRAERKSYEETN